jgi:hypothetical protein
LEGTESYSDDRLCKEAQADNHRSNHHASSALLENEKASVSTETRTEVETEVERVQPKKEVVTVQAVATVEHKQKLPVVA